MRLFGNAKRKNRLEPAPRAGVRILIAKAACLLALTSSGAAGAKIPVATADDLPRHTYDIRGDALELLKDKNAMLDLSNKVRADIEADLADYDIKDRSVLAAYQQLLQSIDMLNGRYDQALARVPTLRDMQTRESDKLLCGITLKSHLAGLKAATGTDGTVDKAKYADAFKAKMRELIKPLPMDVIHDELQQRRSQFKMISPELVTASFSQQLNPMIQGESRQGARRSRPPRSSRRATCWMPDWTWRNCRAKCSVNFWTLSPANGNAAAPAKIDLWTPTLVTLEKNAPAKPVVVGIWDTGVDTTLFPDQLWTNPNPSAGRDDIHGIAFTMDHRPTTGDLYPLDGLKTDKSKCMEFVAASTDMQAGVETPAVEALRNYVLSLRR